MAVGLIIGGLLGYYIPVTIFRVTRSTYDRSVVDNLLTSMFGKYRIEDVLTDEVMAIAYSYNAQ